MCVRNSIFISFLLFLLIVIGQGSYIQEIEIISIIALNENTVLISWDLKVPLLQNSTEVFHIHYGRYNTNTYAGHTNNQSYILRDLTAGISYRIYIAMTYVFSNITYKTDTYQFKIEKIPATEMNIPSIAAISIVVSLTILSIGVLVIVLAICGLKRVGITGKFVRERLQLNGKTNSNICMITSSECNSGNITLNDTAETRKNAISIEETVIEQGIDIDSIYFANISQNDCNVSEITNVIETESISDIPDVLNTENADQRVEYTPEQLSENLSDKTYTIPPTLSKDLNETYEITYKDVENIDQQNTEIVFNIELEFEALNAETSEQNCEFDVNNITLESPNFEGYTLNASYLYNANIIATIHPTRRRDFLQLVYQSKCSLIVMLTSRLEQQSIIARTSEYVRYWPVDEYTNEQEDTLIEQEISLQHSVENNSISFKHIIFTGWDDNGDIEDISNVIKLLRIIQTHKEMNMNTRVIIHCNDGVTKTGILMTCYTALQDMEDRNCYNIEDIVRDLRQQRTNMLPTLTSYRACYRIMEEFSSLQQ
ncbi:tyrosine-protein phosphatase non-receptor type 23 [Oopsacas minuta]|uniref:Tyrosine-protein phosphatase non-receptor type 23 n=1 Tax=Oopsacas minuta TaxID=111878 RepID=A0AAV7JNH2_9METZ|nr:tyrosine-protein phosphatase non-receptor type 23 [Oopsacas minuta]